MRAAFIELFIDDSRRLSDAMTPGTILAEKYEILREIGRGGMGVVYQVRHLGLDRIFALKTLPPYLAEISSARRRLDREARVMAGMEHPNIVRVFDVDFAGSTPFIVMEYVEGENLAQTIGDHGPLSLSSALSIAIDVADGLEYAHRSTPAVIHRDIKPSNIIIESESGRAVVTDFGVAKLNDPDATDFTGPTGDIGSIRYTAPEQALGESELGPTADVFAAGIVLFESVSGDRYYGELDGRQVLAKHLRGDRHVPKLEESLPESVRSLVLRATALDPKARFQSAAEFGKAAQRALSEISPGFQRPDRRRAGSSSSPLPKTGSESAHRSRRTVLRILTAATGAAGAIWLLRRELPSSFPDAVVESADIDTFAVVAFRNQRTGDPNADWYGRALQAMFNTELRKLPQLVVVAPELLERLATTQGIDAMAAARRLGARRFLNGSFSVVGNQMRIDAYVADTATGLQEAAASVEGLESEFFDLQKRLALATLAELSVRLSQEQQTALRDALAARPQPRRVDKLRQLMQVEGVSDPPPTPLQKDENLGALGRRKYLAWLDVLEPASAWAAELGEADRGEIQQLLERYRRATEEGDADALATIFVETTKGQRDGVRSYLDDVADLRVEIREVDVREQDGVASVSYTRRDTFVDPETGEHLELEIRLTKFLVRTPAGWRFAQGNS